MGDLLDNMREAATSHKDDRKGGGQQKYYTGPSYAVQLRAENQQQPLALSVFVDRKGFIYGIECAGQILPFDVITPDDGKKSSLKYAYQSGRQCIIKAMNLIAPKG